MTRELMNETKIKCFIGNCIFNYYEVCQRSEIEINWDVTPTCASYKEL